MIFFADANTLADYGFAGMVLLVILGGLGYGANRILAMAPGVMEWLDKQEAKRCDTLKEMADRIEKSNSALAESFDRSMNRLGIELRACYGDLKEEVQESNRMTAMFVAGLGGSDNGEAVKAKTTIEHISGISG